MSEEQDLIEKYTENDEKVTRQLYNRNHGIRGLFRKLFHSKKRKSRTFTNRELKHMIKALKRFILTARLDQDGDVVGVWFNLMSGQVELYDWTKPMNEEGDLENGI